MKLIRIIHRAGQCMEFILLDEFFRMAGIYIQEQLILANGGTEEIAHYSTLTLKETEVLDQRKYDITLWILPARADGDEKERERSAAIYNGYIPVDAFSGDYMPAGPLQRKALLAILNDIEKKTEFYNAVQQLRDLSDVYCNMNLVHHGYNIRYYFRDNLDQYYEGFKGAYERASALNIAESSRYVRCFRINCARKVNEVCERQSKLLEYSRTRLISELLEMADEDEDDHLPLVLAGYIAEQDSGLRSDALRYYKKAAQKDKGYDSYLYYRLGKYYESRSGGREDPIIYYQKSYEVDPGNYRAWYKIAFLKEFRQEYDECKRIYNAIISRFSKIESANCFQPMEYEYILKCYLRMILLERKHLKNLPAAIDLVKKSLTYYQEISNSHFFSRFYGDDTIASKMYLQMENRIPLKAIQKESKKLEELFSI